MSDRPQDRVEPAHQVGGLEAAAAAIASLIEPEGAAGLQATGAQAGDLAGGDERSVGETHPSGDAHIRARRAGKITV